MKAGVKVESDPESTLTQGRAAVKAAAALKTKDNERVELKSPKIAVTLYELAKEFYGGKVTGGSGVKEVARMLYDLAENPNKKALIKYTRIADLGSGKTREYFN